MNHTEAATSDPIRPNLGRDRADARVRRILGATLAVLQDDSLLPLDVRPSTAHVAKALAALVDVAHLPLADPEAMGGIRQAIGDLAASLDRLQETGGANRAVVAATGAIARAITLLCEIAEQPVWLWSSCRERKSPRVALGVDVGFASESRAYEGFAEDVSDGGLFIATPDPLEIGSEVTVRFDLPDGREILAKAVVRWVRETRQGQNGVAPGIGVEFEPLAAAQMTSIHAFIDDRAPIFHPD